MKAGVISAGTKSKYLHIRCRDEGQKISGSLNCKMVKAPASMAEQRARKSTSPTRVSVFIPVETAAYVKLVFCTPFPFLACPI